GTLGRAGEGPGVRVGGDPGAAGTAGTAAAQPGRHERAAEGLRERVDEGDDEIPLMRVQAHGRLAADPTGAFLAARLQPVARAGHRLPNALPVAADVAAPAGRLRLRAEPAFHRALSALDPVDEALQGLPALES